MEFSRGAWSPVLRGPRLAMMVALVLGIFQAATAADKVLLEESIDDARVFGVGTRLDVTGTLLTAQSGKDPASWAISLSAALSYRERRLLGFGREAESLRSIRDYEVATVEIDVAGRPTSVKLDDRLKLVVAQGQAEGLQFSALDGVFTTDELNLLRTPCDSLGLIALLPNREVEVGESWTPNLWAGQFIAGLDAVTESKMTCKLESVTESIARVTFEGSVDGATLGSTSKVTLKGGYDYDLVSKSISGADMTQTEDRSVGVVSPGMKISARVRLLRKPATIPGRLADEKLVSRGQADVTADALRIRFDSPWNLSLLHDRDWHLFHFNENVAILRMLEQGSFVAQLNVAPIPDVAAGQQTPATDFQKDIQQSLGEKLRSLGAPESQTLSDGRKYHKVTAEGQVGERKMTWIYYLVTAPTGRQASLMFTVDTSQIDKLRGQEKRLVESLRFGPAVRKSTP